MTTEITTTISAYTLFRINEAAQINTQLAKLATKTRHLHTEIGIHKATKLKWDALLRGVTSVPDYSVEDEVVAARPSLEEYGLLIDRQNLRTQLAELTAQKCATDDRHNAMRIEAAQLTRLAAPLAEEVRLLEKVAQKLLIVGYTGKSPNALGK